MSFTIHCFKCGVSRRIVFADHITYKEALRIFIEEEVGSLIDHPSPTAVDVNSKTAKCAGTWKLYDK